jgi:hypothetical protein
MESLLNPSLNHPIWPVLDPSGPHFGQFWTRFGQFWTHFGQSGPSGTRIWSIWTPQNPISGVGTPDLSKKHAFLASLCMRSCPVLTISTRIHVSGVDLDPWDPHLGWIWTPRDPFLPHMARSGPFFTSYGKVGTLFWSLLDPSDPKNTMNPLPMANSGPSGPYFTSYGKVGTPFYLLQQARDPILPSQRSIWTPQNPISGVGTPRFEQKTCFFGLPLYA